MELFSSSSKRKESDKTEESESGCSSSNNMDGGEGEMADCLVINVLGNAQC